MERLLCNAGEAIHAISLAWLDEWQALVDQEREVARVSGEDDPAYKAIGYQKRRMGEEYLLRELASQGFLPAYGFSTHIAAFDNLTLSRFKRIRQDRQENKGRDDNRYQRRELANRDSTSALREYAPGAQIVMDGLVYRSARITLNWKAPASEQDAREPQAIRHAWRCAECGASGWERAWHHPFHCGDCGAAISPQRETLRAFIEPAVFSVDFFDEPGNDVTSQDFIPVEEAWVSANGDWLPLPNPDLGRFRATADGTIFHQSNGLHGEGYALCLYCGRAAPMEPGNIPPSDFETGKLHFPLRGSGKSGRATEHCPGSSEPWAIKPSLSLGDARHTDILEIQLKSETGLWLKDRVVAKTLAVALRDALAEALGVQSHELGCIAKQARPDPNSDAVCESILIFDHFPAGYASSVDRFIGGLFHDVRRRLECPADCDSACPHCVLDFDQRFDADRLDRKKALEFLNEDWLNAYKLPEEHAFFGPVSQAELMPICDAVLREARRPDVELVRLYARGPAQDADLGPSPWRHLAYRIAAMETKAELVIDDTTLSDLDVADRHLLASLADLPMARVVVSSDPCRADKGWLIAECIGSARAMRWAVAEEGALIPNAGWGEAQPITLCDQTAPCSQDGEQLTADQLRPALIGTADREVEIHHELDGRITDFGERFWEHLANHHKALAVLLKSPRERLFVVEFDSGMTVLVRFDQGVSYWRLDRSRDRDAGLFEFSSDSKSQAEALASMNVEIEGSPQPTQVFVSVR